MCLIPRLSPRILPTLLLTGSCLQGPCFADEPTAESVINKVAQVYETMKTYQADGTVVAEIDNGQSKIKRKTTFSIRLMKPDMYRITWSQKGPVAQSGAVWREGGKPYLYMSALNAYSKMTNDEMALGGATGISGGAAFTIPSMFLKLTKGPSSPLASLENPTLEGNETIDGKECFKISGPTAISKKETYWISKEDSLIRKFARSLEAPDVPAPVAEMTDKQIEEALRGLGEEVNAESKAKMKKRMAGIKQMIAQVKLKGMSTETQNDIQSPELKEDDSHFTPPDNAQPKQSLFGNFLQGN
jgi:hypothetical protein